MSEINENYFVVVNEKTATAISVAYSNTKQVKGNNLSTGAIIGAGLVLAIVIIITVRTLKNGGNF